MSFRAVVQGRSFTRLVTSPQLRKLPSLLIIGRRRIARFARVGTFNPPNVLARDLPKRLVRVTRTQEHIAAIGDSYKNEAKFESGEEVEMEEEEEEEDEVPVEPLAKLIVSEEL
ncbi:hypothetical protein FALCPG4_003756 [Fusarium falciforme]